MDFLQALLRIGGHISHIHPVSRRDMKLVLPCVSKGNPISFFNVKRLLLADIIQHPLRLQAHQMSRRTPRQVENLTI
jgi:hypothetical protein